MTIRFVGELLNDRSMPLYELGETFVALQRIVYKAHLHNIGKYEPGAKLAPKDRKAVALCVGGQRRGSDLYEIYQFITSPDGLDLAKQLIPMVLYGVGAYAVGKIVGNKQQPSTNINFITSIYKEVNIITDRIGNIADVTQIDLASDLLKDKKPITIDATTRDYVRSLASDPQLGHPVKLEGTLTKLLTKRLRAELELGPREFVQIRMSEPLFRQVRFSRVGDYVTLRAKPIIRFGEHGRRLREYEAIEILEIKHEGDSIG